MEDDTQRISEIVRDIRVAHEQHVPAEEVFRLIKKFYSTSPYRREVQDVALLTIIDELKAQPARQNIQPSIRKWLNFMGMLELGKCGGKMDYRCL